MSDFVQRLSQRRVLWSRLGPLGRALAVAIEPRQPPILVLSHPRSGSTWVGNTLGRAGGALYLREPLTQAYVRTKPEGVVLEVSERGPPPSYLKAAAFVDRAQPAFGSHVVPYPGQWALGRRSRSRLVVKEVNPLALDWFIARWQPRVIFLVRHPAGVASSFAALGWLGPPCMRAFERRFGPGWCAEIDVSRHLHSPWSQIGAVQAIALNFVRDLLDQWPDHMVVRYEDLCADPIAQFRRLCAFAQLDWTYHVEEAVRLQSGVHEHDRSDAYGTIRNSRRMADAWRRELEPAEIEAVKRAYLHYLPPYYRPEAW